MALYGDYRPKNFADLVGQAAVKTTLLHAAKSGRVSHAYLLCGTRGTGKTTSARILAKAINCENLLDSGDPCGKCDLCQLAEQERLTDIIEIDAASNRGIDDIRDLREKVAFAPNTGKAKIYIIDEVHMLTKEAFNALLKTLEEPPSHAYFILATTEFHKVPETIRSRCQTFFFRKISRNDIVERLEYIADKEKFSYDRLGIEMIAERANGGLRDAISLLEQSASYGPITKENLQKSLGMISPDVFQKFFTGLQSGDAAGCMTIIDEIQNEGRSIEEFGKDFLVFLRSEFHTELTARDSRLPWILELIELFETALRNTRTFEIPPLALEMAIAKALLLQENFSSTLQSVVPQVVSERKKKKKKEKMISVEKKSPPKKISEHDDTDLFPPATEEASVPPWAQEPVKIIEKKVVVKKVAKKINTDLDTFSLVQSHWSDLCGLLPGSIKLTLLQYGSCIEATDTVVTLKIDNASSLVQMKKEKNITKIKEIFSEKLEKNISIILLGGAEHSGESGDLEVGDVESMLQF